MINYLEVKTTGKIALYCPSNVVEEAKKTFLAALHSKESVEDFVKSRMRSKPGFYNLLSKKDAKSNTLPNEQHSPSFSSGNARTNSLKNPQIRSNSTVLPQNIYSSHPRDRNQQEVYSDDGIIESNYDDKITRPAVPRTRFVQAEL